MSAFWRQVRAVATKDLRSEMRAGEVFLVTVPFGALALLMVPLAIGIDTPMLRRIGPGLYWIVVLLFGVMVALRQSAASGPAQRDLVAMLGIDPAARFAGEAFATGALLLGFEVVLAPVAIALYDPFLAGWAWLLLIVPLVAAGLAMLGTLATRVAGSARARTALVPLMVMPLAVPLLLAATQAMEGLEVGRDILGWILLLLAMDLLLAVAGVVSARPLEDTAT